MTKKEKINLKNKVIVNLVNKGYYKTSEEALVAFDGMVNSNTPTQLSMEKIYEDRYTRN